MKKVDTIITCPLTKAVSVLTDEKITLKKLDLAIKMIDKRLQELKQEKK